MRRFSFSDNDLKIAATIVSDAMLDSFPKSSEIRFDLSDDFIQRMNALCIKARHRVLIHNALKRIAIFIIAALMTLGTWLAFDTEARASLTNWIREVYENHIIYRFFGHAKIDTLPIYNITWIPENFICTTDDISDTRRTMFFENDKTNEAVVFDYYLLEEGFQTHYINDFGDRELVVVNGQSSDFYPASGDSITNSLIWIDEKSGIVFHLDSTLSKSVILHIAGNIDLCETPK